MITDISIENTVLELKGLRHGERTVKADVLFKVTGDSDVWKVYDLSLTNSEVRTQSIKSYTDHQHLSSGSRGIKIDSNWSYVFNANQIRITRFHSFTSKTLYNTMYGSKIRGSITP